MVKYTHGFLNGDDHATINFHKPSRVFYVMSTYNKTTTDYMKYSSKMAESHVYEIFNSVLKNKLTSIRLNRAKAIRFEKNYNQGCLN